MSLLAHQADYLNRFHAAHGPSDSSRFVGAFCFGDTEIMANALAELVLCGRKRATSSLAWAYEEEGAALPRVGDLSLVTDWAGNPLCIIATQAVVVLPFEAITADFAAREGEGDGSLAAWQQVHAAFFRHESAAAGRTFSSATPIVCESFEVIHRATDHIRTH
jgi:uncharacterized protein YhfF